MDITSVFVGLFTGIVFAWLFYRQKSTVISGLESTVSGYQIQLSDLNTDLTKTRMENSSLVAEVSSLRKVSEQSLDDKAKLEELRNTYSKEQSEVARLKTQLELERSQTAEKIELLKDAEKSLKDQFKILATEIFEEKDKKFKEESKKSIESLISPFKDDLKDFRNKIEENGKSEHLYRGRMNKILEDFMKAQGKLSEDAENLTKALKGDKKLQGCWGEIVLERVLEDAGLCKDREFFPQLSKMDSEGNRYQPDIIVRLPENREIIIDSKVSLVAYERFISQDTEEGKQSALKDHIRSIKNHIKLLSEKKYESLDGISCLDYTMMFMPMEGAMLAALDEDPSIFDQAFKKKIVLTTPSTLMISLKTIEGLWQIEKQNKNSELIAGKAAALYDKFCLLLKDLQKMGYHLEKLQGIYVSTEKRLTSRGNLVDRCQELVEMGVKSSKSIPEKYLDASGGFIDEDGAA